MQIARLDIQSVRNIAGAGLELSPGINLLTGPNGAGKTAVLEAVYLLLRGRSFRATKPRDLIRHGDEHLAIAMTCRDESSSDVRLKTVRDREGRVELYRDEVRLRRTSALASVLPLQLLLPNISDLVFGGPALRREWLDWGTFHVKPGYMSVLRNYTRAVSQRNARLRAMTTAAPDASLDAWTEQIIELGQEVTETRLEYLAAVESDVQSCLATLAPELTMSLSLKPGWNGKNLAEALAQSLSRDVKLGTTQAGPHRADVDIVCNEVNAAATLSRGQGKMVAGAMHIGQAQNLAKAHRRSLFLIDEVSAELDQTHNDKMFDLLARLGSQIIATSAREGTLAGGAGNEMFPVKHFRVDGGRFESD